MCLLDRYNLFTFRTDIVNFLNDSVCGSMSEGTCGFYEIETDFCANLDNAGLQCNAQLIKFQLYFLVLVTTTFCLSVITVFGSQYILLQVSLSHTLQGRLTPYNSLKPLNPIS